MLDAIDFGLLFWLILVALTGIGEMLTGTFLLVPFLIGAIVAALLVALGANLMLVLLAFGFVTVVGFAWVLRFANRTKGDPPATHEGAGRYIDQHGPVIQDVHPEEGGRVHIGGQSWRALSSTGEAIATGSRVRVIEVRGTALVVEPEDRTQP